jgi:DNA-binding transcriptional LysR family regulator
MVHSSPHVPPLDTLEAFTWAARSGAVSAAAEQLGLTHGAISRQVSRLERWMGVRLFERAPRGVALTPEGLRFFGRAEEALTLLGNTSERWTPRRGTAVVRLSITPSLTALWLFPRLRDLAEFSDGLDLAVRCGRGPWPGVRSIPLWREEAVPVAAPLIARALGAQPTPADLLDWALLHDSNAEGWRAWLAASGVVYTPRAKDRRFEDYNLVLEACIQGLGIAIGRSPLAGDAITAGKVVALYPTTRPYHVAFHLLRAEEPLRVPAAEMAARLMRAAGLAEREIEAFVAPGRARADRAPGTSW